MRRARLRRIAAAMGVVAALGLLVALYQSPAMRVHKVEVLGVATVSESEVRGLAAFHGDSMLTLDAGAARERIARLPMVESVQIQRRWPQGIRIQIVERTAWGIWQVGDLHYVIDGAGVVLPSPQPAEGAPVIVDLTNPGRLIPGDHVDADAVALVHALRQRVPEELALNVASAEYSADKGLTVVTDTGYRVVMGDSQNIDYKLAVWEAIEQRLGRESMTGHVLDLRFGDHPSFQ